jgi:hypothetical protein
MSSQTIVGAIAFGPTWQPGFVRPVGPVCYGINTAGGRLMARDGKQKQPKRDVSAEVALQHERNRGIAKIIDGVGGLLRHLGTAACVFGVVYEMRVALQSIAGQTTTLNSSVIWRISIGLTASVAWGAVASVGWYRERRLRKKLVSDTTPYIGQLESKIDPNRQTSGLSPTG